jgi:TRAP-type C4-dicarboxylate transport system substrate-binding protein
MVVSQRALSSLSVRGQQALRSAAAKFMARFEDVSRTLEEQLVGGLFEKQGLKRVPVTDRFRSEFYDAARRTRERLAGKGIPPGILEETLKWLADHRAETLASGRSGQ